MFVITKSKATDLPKRDTNEYADMLRKSQYAAMSALTDPLMDGLSPGKKQRWHKKCIKEMQRVSKWFDDNKIETTVTLNLEFGENETIEQWTKRIRDGIENILPGL